MDYIKLLIFDVIVKAAIQRLFLAVPFLGWGPIGLVVSFYISKFADFAYAIGKEIVMDIEFKFKNKEHQSAFDDELVKLKILENDNSSEEEIENGIKKSQDRLADLVVTKHIAA